MRIGLSLLKLAVAVVVVASVSDALAQGGGGRRGGGGRGGVQPLAVAQHEAVQKDMEVSADQKTKLTALSEDPAFARGGRGQGGGGGGGDPEAARLRREEQIKKINEVLLAVQQERFGQILLQVQQLNAALGEPKVADKLGLTADQKSKLTTLNTDYQAKQGELFQGGGGGGPEAFTNLVTEWNNKAKELLTADQKTNLEKLQGKKLDAETLTAIRAAGRGGRGGPGGAGAGPGGGQGRGRRGQPDA